uniref:lipopolysaccharide core heptose(II)-phosphate phosphatase n=1 Tax=Salmonella enterica TaxID=28901 RepID=UPI001EEFB544
GTVCVVGKMRDLILQLSKSSIYSTKPLYSSNTVRTIQSATWFSAGRSLTVDKKMMDCGSGIYASINTLLKKSQNKNIVIFTHNHCLTYIAKNKRGVKFDPDYLNALVMHAENGKLFLDGEFVPG